MNFKDDEYTCIASLVPFGKKQSENQKTALSLAFNSAINDVYKSSLRSWKKIVQMYILENTDFLLGLMPEFEFLVKVTKFQKKLLSKGCKLSYPQILPMSERVFDAAGLYNPCVALKVDGDVVANDIVFDDDAKIYVLSGNVNADELAAIKKYVINPVEAREASLAAKEQILVSILGADTRNVDGKIFGTMLISLPEEPARKQRALEFLNAYQGVVAEEVDNHA